MILYLEIKLKYVINKNMKKLTLILMMAITTLSCSSNDDEVVKQEKQFFNPPTWIQGKWYKDGTPLYKFTQDDFYVIAGSNETSFKAILQQGESGGTKSSVDESISDTNYDFVIKSGAANYEYKFKKITDTKIQWVNYPYTSSVGAYYLTK